MILPSKAIMTGVCYHIYTIWAKSRLYKNLENNRPGQKDLLKAIDIEYLISGSRNLNIQMQTLLEKVNKASSQLSLAESPEKKVGEQTTS